MTDHPTGIASLTHKLREEELTLLMTLRERRHKTAPITPSSAYSLGDRIADRVAAGVGSWPFIIVQSLLLILWMVLNVTGWIYHWDPYPFILLNLALSFQAAYAAPFIMMSQNRQASIDRIEAQNDYHVNIKAELEIELLHEKIDQMRQEEISHLRAVVEDLSTKLVALAAAGAAAAKPNA
jgi:uncharacterized membrane protein